MASSHPHAAQSLTLSATRQVPFGLPTNGTNVSFQQVNTTPPFLNLVVLRSSDLEKAAGFYRELGLEFTRHAHGKGPEHYASEANGIVFEIYPASSKFPSTAGTRVGFLVESADSIIARLVTLGATVISAPADSEWGRRAVVQDFDGHTIELLTAPPVSKA